MNKVSSRSSNNRETMQEPAQPPVQATQDYGEKVYEWAERQVVAAEAQARATEGLAAAIMALARGALQGGMSPAVVAERPARPEKVVAKEDVRRAMVAVAKARGGDFLVAFLKGKFGCESIAGLGAGQYGEALAALTEVLKAAGGGGAR